MRTVELKLYKFDELSKEVQEKVIQNNRDINVYDDWHEFILEDWINEVIPNKGFDATNIYYSGFWSQGDGAMFEYRGITDELFNEFLDTLNLSPMRMKWLVNNIHTSVSGRHSGHYSHEGCCSHSIYWEVDNGNLHYSTNFYQWLESFADEFEAFIIDRYKDICRELYRALEESYDYLTEERQIVETLYGQDYDYTEDGNIY
jgi:hypothetical protein